MRAPRITLRHYYDFGPDRSVVGRDLVSPEAWDRLRTQTQSPFSIPDTPLEFARAAERLEDVAERARAVDAWLENHAAQSVASYGVGGAPLEWWLHRLRPDRDLTLTDYGQATVEHLAKLFPEAKVYRHDLRYEGPLIADIHLFHRIDTELTNREWRQVMRRFARLPILVVAGDVLDMRKVVVELGHRRRMKRRGASRAGFVRTRAALESLWRSTHWAKPLRVHDLDAWALVPMKPAHVDEADQRPS